ncbi:hypothetical protein VPH35_099138 [Triticum aestivum]
MEGIRVSSIDLARATAAYAKAGGERPSGAADVDSFWLLVMSRRRILMKDLIKKNRRHSGLLLKLLAGVATLPSNCRFEDVNLPDIFFMGIEYFSDISENYNDLSASRRSSDSVFATKESVEVVFLYQLLPISSDLKLEEKATPDAQADASSLDAEERDDQIQMPKKKQAPHLLLYLYLCTLTSLDAGACLVSLLKTDSYLRICSS